MNGKAFIVVVGLSLLIFPAAAWSGGGGVSFGFSIGGFYPGPYYNYGAPYTMFYFNGFGGPYWHHPRAYFPYYGHPYQQYRSYPRGYRDYRGSYDYHRPRKHHHGYRHDYRGRNDYYRSRRHYPGYRQGYRRW